MLTSMLTGVSALLHYCLLVAEQHFLSLLLTDASVANSSCLPLLFDAALSSASLLGFFLRRRQASLLASGEGQQNASSLRPINEESAGRVEIKLLLAGK